MKDPKESPEESGKGLNRRHFLQLSTLGAAAPLVMGAGTVEPPTPTEEETVAAEEAEGPLKDLPETWDEPWVWEPSKFPGESLQLNVIEHQTPSTIVGFGNPNAALFSFNGGTPGPTIRMKGDEILRVKLFNHLGLNQGDSIMKLWPDIAYYLPTTVKNKKDEVVTRKPQYPDPEAEGIVKPDWQLGEHINGIHTIHTTNLHTHGLHVRPGENVDGTHSDNIYLRVIPQQDLAKRETNRNYNGPFLLEGEQAGSATYEFRLGRNNGHSIATHPPGTHWYHPHAHGATNMQVASGMAGFLVVEGDVDEAINKELTGKRKIDTTFATGKYQYRERLMFLQRVLFPAVDQDSKREEDKAGATPAINGTPNPSTIVMAPGAIERWRVLNGSVDGKGYIRFMVLRGKWVHQTPPWATNPKTQDEPKYMGNWESNPLHENISKTLENTSQLLYVKNGVYYLPATDFIEEMKQDIHQLAKDGVTLVKKVGEKGQYYLKDLSKLPGKNPLYQDFSNLGDCYKNADNLKACYNLPNELYMAPANRADFIFKAPGIGDSQAREFTVIGKATAIHTENLERNIQLASLYAGQTPAPKVDINFPSDTIIARIIVRGEQLPNYKLSQLSKVIGEVPLPPYLSPIPQEEVQVTKSDPDHSSQTNGKFRTRKIVYSGWGADTWPTLYPKDVRKDNPSSKVKPIISDTFQYNPHALGIPNENPSKGDMVVVPSLTKTMGIDGKKFNPDDKDAPRPLLKTAEEWVVYNDSISLFGAYPDFSQTPVTLTQNEQADAKLKKANEQAKMGWAIKHRIGYAVSRNEAKAYSAEPGNKQLLIATRGIDHPFHIHTNPFWLMKVEVPDADGNLVNILPEPIWQDVIWLPRNGGRVVFRSRFPDFVGKMVNHCHILQHEDNGMMQEVQITPSLDNQNCDFVSQLPSLDGQPIQVDFDGAYARCSKVIDHNHNQNQASHYPAKNGVFKAPKLT